eukprot:2563593-Prymnesium_polylepis.1
MACSSRQRWSRSSTAAAKSDWDAFVGHCRGLLRPARAPAGSRGRHLATWHHGTDAGILYAHWAVLQKSLRKGPKKYGT